MCRQRCSTIWLSLNENINEKPVTYAVISFALLIIGSILSDVSTTIGTIIQLCGVALFIIIIRNICIRQCNPACLEEQRPLLTTLNNYNTLTSQHTSDNSPDMPQQRSDHSPDRPPPYEVEQHF